MKEGDVELLKKIVEYEETVERDLSFGWEWRDVRVWPSTLNRFCLEGYLDTIFKSNRQTRYRLTDLGYALAKGETESEEPPQEEALSLADDLFDDIIGHDEVKELLRACLLAEKPVHVLLAGPPALAKTLFLWDIERAAGSGRAIWLVGSATSKAGLWDLVAEKQPYVLLIDELDKMNAADTAALLSMMEGGRLVRAKKGRELCLQQALRVVAATNRLDGLSPELLSRFAVRRIQAYCRSDYLTVVKGVLVRREDVPAELAEEIARRLDGRTQDVRDAVRVARLAPQLGVDKAVKLLLGG
jgi:Holliday junction DNA helicase RuvB